MDAQVEKLLTLQELDLKIRAMNTRIKTIPTEIKKISKEIENEKTNFAKQKEILMSEELDIKKVEANTKEKEEQIRKLQSQSYMIKKNDEYRALMNEIKGVKKIIGEFETEQLVLMEKIQDNTAKVKDLDASLKEKRKQTDEEIKDLSQIENKIKNEIAKLTAEREKYAGEIDKSALGLYERLLSTGSGAPVAEARDAICSNCHLKLTPHTNNQARKNIITQCDNCAHIIYIKE